MVVIIIWDYVEKRSRIGNSKWLSCKVTFSRCVSFTLKMRCNNLNDCKCHVMMMMVWIYVQLNARCTRPSIVLKFFFYPMIRWFYRGFQTVTHCKPGRRCNGYHMCMITRHNDHVNYGYFAKCGSPAGEETPSRLETPKTTSWKQ